MTDHEELYLALLDEIDGLRRERDDRSDILNLTQRCEKAEAELATAREALDAHHRARVFVLEHPECGICAALAAGKGENRVAVQIGYYIRPDQPIDQPTFDPGMDAPCPVCGLQFTLDSVRTVSVMYDDGRDGISLFYRLHRRCHDGLTIEQEQTLDQQALDMGSALAVGRECLICGKKGVGSTHGCGND